MKCLISAKEVLMLAFTKYDHIDEAAILETKIRAAQNMFLRTKLGDVYEALLKGEYSDFCNEYIKPALAYYVKYGLLPDLSVKVGNNGAQVAYTQFSDSATDKQREILRQQALEDGNNLLNVAIQHIKKHREEFHCKEIPFKQTKIIGGVIL